MMIELSDSIRAALALGGAALFFAGVCRLRNISKETTLRRVRAAVVGWIGASAMLALSAMFRPDLILISAAAVPFASVAWAAATAHAWRTLPSDFARRRPDPWSQLVQGQAAQARDKS